MQLWDNKDWLTSTFLKSDTVSDLPLGIREALKAIQDRIIRETPKDTVTPTSVQAIQHNILVLVNRLPEYAKDALLKTSLSKETRRASQEMKDTLEERKNAINDPNIEPSLVEPKLEPPFVEESPEPLEWVFERPETLYRWKLRGGEWKTVVMSVDYNSNLTFKFHSWVATGLKRLDAKSTRTSLGEAKALVQKWFDQQRKMST